MRTAEKVILAKEISKSVRCFQKTHKKNHTDGFSVKHLLIRMVFLASLFSDEG